MERLLIDRADVVISTTHFGPGHGGLRIRSNLRTDRDAARGAGSRPLQIALAAV